MKCPHCLESFHDFYVIPVGNNASGDWGVISRKLIKRVQKNEDLIHNENMV